MLCLAVFPLSAWTTPLPTVMAWIISVGFPFALSWSLAFRGAGVYRWGLASGLAVGLHCAGQTFKCWAFFQETRVGRSGGTSKGMANSRLPQVACSRNAGGVGGQESAGIEGVHGSRDGVAEKRGGDGAAGGAGHDGMPSDGRLEMPKGRRVILDVGTHPGPDGESVTFSEFLYFLLAVPSLVCKLPLLKANRQSAPNVSSAASELFHAVLTYVTIHACAVSIYAPLMRVLSARIDASSWTAFDEAVEALRHGEGGGGGWVTSLVWPIAGEEGAGGCEGYAGVFLGSEWRSSLFLGRLAVLCLSFFAGIMLLAPFMHFTLFYAFFHCLCMASAEFWGYPDRDLYGEQFARSIAG